MGNLLLPHLNFSNHNSNSNSNSNSLKVSNFLSYLAAVYFGLELAAKSSVLLGQLLTRLEEVVALVMCVRWLLREMWPLTKLSKALLLLHRCQCNCVRFWCCQ